MPTVRQTNVLCLVALLSGLSGCGGANSGAPTQPLVPISGKVTLKGQPLASASVVFTPRGSTPGAGAYGVTDANGVYVLKHKSESDGVEPGEYAVVISKMAMKDGSPIPEGKTAADVEAVQAVPPAYSDPSSDYAGNKVTVAKDTSTLNFDIP